MYERTLVANCPRCGVKNTTFVIKADNQIAEYGDCLRSFEVLSICRDCWKSVILILVQKEIGYPNESPHEFEGRVNNAFTVTGYVRILDSNLEKAPDHTPAEFKSPFEEAVLCLNVECFNASAAMFRLCLDLVTQKRLPKDGPGLGDRQRKYLYDRLKWLFANQLLPKEIEEFSDVVRDDGNDAVHVGNMSKGDTERLLDFTRFILTRLYTDPQRIQEARQRKKMRKATEG